MTATRWTCFGDHRACVRILFAMGATQAIVNDALRFFRKRGGYCDCEVLLNVVDREAVPSVERGSTGVD